MCHDHVISRSMFQMIFCYHFFNISTIIVIQSYFYLVIFFFICNTIYVFGNSNKQSLLSLLTAIKHYLPLNFDFGRI